MPFTPKDWIDESEGHTTPITAAALEDLETRVTDYAEGYADSVVSPGGEGGLPDGWFYPGDFGGDATGAVDSYEAVQAALDAADAVDGTVYLGGGDAIWKYDTQLLMPSAVRLTSGSGGGRGGAGKATLRYTGTGTSAAFLAAGKQRFMIDNVEFDYNNVDFTGALVVLYGEPSDIINAHLHHCHFCAIQGLASLSATALLRCHNVIFSKISECSFNGAADNLLQLGRPETGQSYINGVKIVDCAFNDTANEDRGQIGIFSGDMEATVIDGCGFEGASPNNITPIRGANASDGDSKTNLIYALTVSNCWSGDAGGAGPDNGFALGLNGQADFGPIVFQGNFIAPAGGTCVTAGDNGAAFVFIGNHATQGILSGTNGDVDSTYKAIYLYNSVGGAASDPLYDALFAVGDEPTQYTRFATADNHLSGRVGIGHHVDFDDVSTWPDSEKVVLGAHVPNSTALLAIGDRVAMYSRDNASSTDRSLVLQAPSDDNGGEVQMVAGTTPTRQVRASGVGVAFNGTAPIAKPTITGSKGGNAALADLLTKLASLGLITDSTS